MSPVECTQNELFDDREVQMRTQSYSSVSMFKRCPGQYKRRYIDGETTETTPAMEHGKAVHTCIAEPPKEEVPEKVKRESEVARNNYDLDEPGDSTRIIPMGTELLTPDEDALFGFCGIVEGHELPFALTAEWEPVGFDSPDAVFRGIIDYLRLSVIGNRVVETLIVDWKTGSSKADKFQLDGYALYCLLVFRSPVTAEFFYTQSATKDRYRYSPEDVLILADELRECIFDLVSAEEFPTTPGKHCNWCSFRDDCPDADVFYSGNMTSEEVMERMKRKRQLKEEKNRESTKQM